MIGVDVLVPVLGRPDRAAPLVASLAASVTGPLLWARLTFLCSPGDDAQIAACVALGGGDPTLVVDTAVMSWEPGGGDYARKINWGWVQACTWQRPDRPDFVLLGADDLRFTPGWLEAALIAQLETGACVIGTNDLGNRSVMNGTHATHPLVSTAYPAGLIDNDDRGLLLNQAYGHNWVDNEFVGTAKARGTYTAAARAHVEHMHPIWGKGAHDDTYARGQSSFHQDAALHDSRRHLWEATRA